MWLAAEQRCIVISNLLKYQEPYSSQTNKSIILTQYAKTEVEMNSLDIFNGIFDGKLNQNL